MSPKAMAFKQNKRVRGTKNRYLKPGALAKIRDSRTGSKSCTDIGKKRIVVLDSKDEKVDIFRSDEMVVHNDTHIASPSPINVMAPPTPKTPENFGRSRLESLPIDVLVKILCFLHHDQLRPVFHVSQRVRKAVLMARQYHFNYTTPDRSRQEMLRTQTPLPTEHWPFGSNGDGSGIYIPSPVTPQAPKPAPRLPRLHNIDLQPIAAALFKDEEKPSSKAIIPNRLFCEDELCQAVAQNNLQ